MNLQRLSLRWELALLPVALVTVLVVAVLCCAGLDRVAARCADPIAPHPAVARATRKILGMTAAALPSFEADRLALLRELDVLDHSPDGVLEGLTRLASQLTGPLVTPSAAGGGLGVRRGFQGACALPVERHRPASRCAHCKWGPA